jgi:hypothetical protein
LPGAQILTWIGAEVIQARRIAKKVFLPFVHVAAHRILAAYFHSANGVDHGSACRRLVIWPLDEVTLVISLVAHVDPNAGM